MKRFRASLLALLLGLLSCAASADTETTFSCDPEELYACYDDVLEQILPMDLYEFPDIVFRRYDTYARARNPTEFVASLGLVYRNGQRVIEATYRQLLEENLYTQLSSGVSDDEVLATVRWSDHEFTSLECPAVIDVWEKARRLQLNELSDMRQFDLPESDDADEIVVRLHARIFEAAFEVDDQTIAVIQEGGPTEFSDWVQESIGVLESCGANK